MIYWKITVRTFCQDGVCFLFIYNKCWTSISKFEAIQMVKMIQMACLVCPTRPAQLVQSKFHIVSHSFRSTR